MAGMEWLSNISFNHFSIYSGQITIVNSATNASGSGKQDEYIARFRKHFYESVTLLPINLAATHPH